MTKEVKYDFSNPRPLPDEYPMPTLSGVDVAFSTARGCLHQGGAYLSYHEGQCGLVDRKWEKVADALFFNGGKVEDHGLKLREGIDKATAYNTLRWLLSSWEPKQEQKSATVGFVISKWWEPIAEPVAS